MDTTKIREFKRHVENNLVTPINMQECQIRKGKGLINGKSYKLWTADLWTIEICDHLLNSEANENKYPDDYPYRGELEYQVWETWKHKVNMYKNLIKIKDESDTIVIGEVGRGVDLLLAQMIKDWKHILAYDHALPYEPLLRLWFKGYEYYTTSTAKFLTTDKYIKSECILIINETKFRKWDKINQNIKNIIWNGEYLYK